ncbi:MAG: FtsW/RodA/SpoVE family cell cycle protein [Ruminococcus flavefaciens]|nr:FtsW/RodA/SpoVE family cell cycle protein [Ruminococcus flavefaciens]MCM1229327.1 FtsW/RodA/SpoVE family cell cycle protein [Ruminococcus flavefaciens]
MSNPFSYAFSCIFVLIAHGAMLANVFINGSYDNPNQPFVLACAVAGLDIAYFIAMPFFKQKTYAVDFMLLLILNMSLIFQSCFGEIRLDLKHFITCISALVSCRLGYILCRNHRWIQNQKKFVWLGIGLLMVIIFLFTGSRSMWIDLGFMTIQPSEFIKPLLVLACATSIAEQQKKHQIMKFSIVYDNIIIFAIVCAVILFQWWCRDLGSIPTFAAIYASGFLLRICYPKEKFSRKTLVTAGIGVAVAGIIAVIIAPDYVKDRLFADIWSNPDGNGYQQTKALIGIAEGGWFGKGPGNGFLCNVFAYESDIVFSTICEEWGLLIGLMTVLMLLILIAMPLINPPRSYYHGTMCAGICSAFTVQMALNIFGSCNMIPFTGVTLPFISAGGSSMVTSGLMVGMLVAVQSPEFKNPSPNKKKPVQRRSAV